MPAKNENKATKQNKQKSRNNFRKRVARSALSVCFTHRGKTLKFCISENTMYKITATRPHKTSSIQQADLELAETELKT